METKICPVCGDEFHRGGRSYKEYPSKFKNRIYCSRKCSANRAREEIERPEKWGKEMSRHTANRYRERRWNRLVREWR